MRFEGYISGSSKYVVDQLFEAWSNERGKLSRVDDESFTLEIECGIVDPSEFFRDTLDRIVALLHVFRPGVAPAFSVRNFRQTDPPRPGAFARKTIRFIVHAPGNRLAEKDADGVSLLESLLALVDEDKSVRHALTILRRQEIGWADLYDVIEFLSDLQQVGGKEPNIERHRRTANFHRHRGRLKPDPLPNNPPTLEESRKYICGLLEEWLVRQARGQGEA